jgi:hypothetical protein
MWWMERVEGYLLAEGLIAGIFLAMSSAVLAEALGRLSSELAIALGAGLCGWWLLGVAE